MSRIEPLEGKIQILGACRARHERGGLRRIADGSYSGNAARSLSVNQPTTGLEEAAERLSQLLRSNNMETAMWADSVIKQHILPEPEKHLPFPYMKRPYD